jgi:hypothetical protein
MFKWFKSLFGSEDKNRKFMNDLDGALSKDDGELFVNLLEMAIREGLIKDISGIGMNYKDRSPSGIAIQKQYNVEAGFETDAFSVVFLRRCYNTINVMVEKGILKGNEAVWLGNEEEHAIVSGCIAYALNSSDGPAFVSKGGEAFKNLMMGTPGKEHWLLNFLLISCETTWEYDNVPKDKKNALKVHGFLPTSEILAQMILENWVSAEEVVAIQEKICLEYKERKTASSENLIDWIPKELFASCQAELLKKSMPNITNSARKLKVL